MELSGYPSFRVPSTTKDSLSSLMTASKVRNRTASPLRIRPVQNFPRDLATYDPPPAATSFQFVPAMLSISLLLPGAPGCPWAFPVPWQTTNGARAIRQPSQPLEGTGNRSGDTIRNSDQ